MTVLTSLGRRDRTMLSRAAGNLHALLRP
jgi:hypothetical protein